MADDRGPGADCGLQQTGDQFGRVDGAMFGKENAAEILVCRHMVTKRITLDQFHLQPAARVEIGNGALLRLELRARPGHLDAAILFEITVDAFVIDQRPRVIECLGAIN